MLQKYGTQRESENIKQDRNGNLIAYNSLWIYKRNARSYLSGLGHQKAIAKRIRDEAAKFYVQLTNYTRSFIFICRLKAICHITRGNKNLSNVEILKVNDFMREFLCFFYGDVAKAFSLKEYEERKQGV